MISGRKLCFNFLYFGQREIKLLYKYNFYNLSAVFFSENTFGLRYSDLFVLYLEREFFCLVATLEENFLKF